MTTNRGRLVLLTAAVLLASVGACKSAAGETHASPPPPQATSSSPVPQSTTPGTSAASPSSLAPTDQAPVGPTPLHGIVIAYKTDKDTVELLAVDPGTGNVTATRTFSDASSGANVALDDQDPGRVWVQAFNRDLSELAATGPEQADGSQSAGYLVGDKYVPLTADTSGGYGTVLKKQAIAFNPKTGYLWYQTPQGNGGSDGIFGTVDPTTHRDAVVKNVTPFSNGVIGGYNDRVFFRPDGMPEDIAVVPSNVYLPGGPEVDRAPVNWGFQIGEYGKVDVDMTPTTPLSPKNAEIGWMGVPVSSKTFLAKSDTQLYLDTVGPGVVSVKPLLPTSNRQLGDMAVSPDHNNVAYISSIGNSGGQLWTTSLAGGANPVQLKAFRPLSAISYGVLGWFR